MAALGSLTLKTLAFDMLADKGFITAPMLQPKSGKSLQWINRVLKELADNHKLKLIGKLGNANCYVGMRSQRTIEDIQRIIATRETKPTAWAGQDFSPEQYVKLLTPDKQKTAQKLFDSDDPKFVDFFNQILPAMEMICFGKRASRQVEIDAAYALVGEYAERIHQVSTFLRLFLDNSHIRSGNFAEHLSDYTVNNYRSAYTRESA